MIVDNSKTLLESDSGLMKDTPQAEEEQLELVNHLCRNSVLDQMQATKVHDEMLSFYAETVKEYVQRRHSELQEVGMVNAATYQQIQRELDSRRFAADVLSERQIRRIIYG